MKRCLGCGTLTPNARCPRCKTQQRAKYHNGWQQHAAQHVAHHIAQHGYTCPGWRCPPHESHDLTLDHGPPEQVLCRPCNTRKRNLGDG